MKIKSLVILCILSLTGVNIFAQGGGLSTAAKNVVIVHGAFADGSGWEGVYRILTNDGYNVTIVQNSTASLAADVIATQNVLANQDGPVVLVGHSYGGEVITQAGDNPKVKSLVYVAAFVPDVNESLGSLSERLAPLREPDVAPPPIVPQNPQDPQNKFLLLDPAKFAKAFAADITLDKARFLAASQVPIAGQTLSDVVTKVAWKTKPSYYIISGQDHMIPPAAEKMMATRAKSTPSEIKGASHAVYISHPADVATVIKKAASK